MEQLSLRIGIDIGGTFTDAIAVSPHGISTAKVPSRADQPGAAVLDALNALQLEEVPDRLFHGTTLVTMLNEHGEIIEWLGIASDVIGRVSTQKSTRKCRK